MAKKPISELTDRELTERLTLAVERVSMYAGTIVVLMLLSGLLGFLAWVWGV